MAMDVQTVLTNTKKVQQVKPLLVQGLTFAFLLYVYYDVCCQKEV